MAIRLNLNEIGGIGMTSARTRARLVDRLREQGIKDESVLAVMGQIPRHLFVDEALAHKAYDDTSLPIGLGQTISQPYIVARMTELANSVKVHDKVLEIGTGCGYQTTVLAQIFKTVYSIERIAGLHKVSRERLSNLGVHNVRLRHGDGSKGLADGAPYNVILITAAAPITPQDMLSQLAPGGKMIFPMGKEDQELHVIESTPAGFVETRLEKVKFVPLLPGVS